MMSAGIGLGAGFPLGQQMGQNMSVNPPQSDNTSNDISSKMKQLKDLLDEGLISEDQFKEKQSKLIEDL